jgi:subtilisin family serine protease
MKTPELLSPAGDLDRVHTALLYGADAVYIGGEMYGLRAKAKNFSRQDMAEGIAYAHAHGVKVYVTANIVAHNDDLAGVEAYFQELKEFVQWAKFDRMGAFSYSEEEGTYSAEHYQDDVPKDVKQRRLDELMAIQQRMAIELNGKKVGQTMQVIIDRVEGDFYIGRTEFDSPEVDPEVLIHKSEGVLEIGSFYEVQITDAEEFDLYAKIVNC